MTTRPTVRTEVLVQPIAAPLKLLSSDGNKAEVTEKTGGRAGSQTRICSFGRCRVVPLHNPPSGTCAGSPTRISSLGPKRHHALTTPAYLMWRGCRELNSDLKVR